MKIPQDARFRREAERFQLRWNCEDCSRYMVEADACSHGFPTEKHKSTRYLDPDAALLFCKDFELT